MKNIPSESLLAALTRADTPRVVPLSRECGVICLTRIIRSLNLVRAETLDELYTRRESAAVLADLRFRVQSEAHV
jgi:hypothetical protein